MEVPVGYIHNPFGGSKSYHLDCPGSLPMEEKAKAQGLALEQFEEQTERGTLRHLYSNDEIPIEEVPEEHRWAAMQARKWISTWGSGHDMIWEIMLPIMLDGEILTWTKADIVGWDFPSPFCLDLKHGEGIPSEKSLLWQMTLGAVGTMQKFDTDQCDVAVYHVKSGIQWRDTFKGMKPLADHIRFKIDYAKKNPEKLVFSNDTCFFCRGKWICPEFKKETKKLESLPMLWPAVGQPKPAIVQKLKRFDDMARMMKPLLEAWNKKKKEFSDETLAALGYERKTRMMPVMQKTEQKYEQIYLARKDGAGE